MKRLIILALAIALTACTKSTPVGDAHPGVPTTTTTTTVTTTNGRPGTVTTTTTPVGDAHPGVPNTTPPPEITTPPPDEQLTVDNGQLTVTATTTVTTERRVPATGEAGTPQEATPARHVPVTPSSVNAGPLTIGFFDRPDRLEFRVNQSAVSGFLEIHSNVTPTLKGITRLGEPSTDYGSGGGPAVSAWSPLWNWVMSVTTPIPAGKAMAYIKVEGVGSVQLRGEVTFMADYGVAQTLNLNITISNERVVTPHTYTDGDLTIGFFDFKDGRGTRLEIRTKRMPSAFGITQPYSLEGITRVRATHLNDDALGGPPGGAYHPGLIILAGAVTADYGFSPNIAAALAWVDGTGLITFDNVYSYNGQTRPGEFAIVWLDGTMTEYDLSGVVLSNRQ